MDKNIEIIDWGCGQGIGSCTIIDILQQRDLLQWVKRITMIEPSSQALNRAEQNIYKITQNNIPINTINKYLPSYNIDTSDTLNSINYSCKNVINIFSNIFHKVPPFRFFLFYIIILFFFNASNMYIS